MWATRINAAERSAVAGVLAGRAPSARHRRASPTDTIGALIDAYEAAWPGLPRKLADSTKEQYRRSLRVVRKAWGDLQAESLRPSHVQALIEKIGADNAGIS